MLSLTLFGRFHAALESFSVTEFRTTKVQALLIYLAAEPQPHSRESLMDLLWPGMPLQSARHNLRQVLYYLRGLFPEVQALPESASQKVPLVLADRQKIQLNPDAEIWTDIHIFQELVKRTQSHKHPDLLLCTDCRQDLEEAASLYQGDFSTDFFLPDSVAFEEWVLTRRAELQRQFLNVLEKLGRLHLANGHFAAAEEVARKQLAADDFREGAQRLLLEAMARTGRRNQALSHYDALRKRLWDELGVAPEAATIELVDRIERGKLQEAGVHVDGGADSGPDAPDGRPPPLPQFLVNDATPDERTSTFVARIRELSRLGAALSLARGGQGQVIFVIGGAGRGKSTLMREFARQAQDHDPNLVVITGHCKAIVGIGDPYHPFREALTMLAGDVEARWAGGLIRQKHARQLWELMPFVLPALVKHAPDLIERFVSGEGLRERALHVLPKNNTLLDQILAHEGTRQGASLDQAAIIAQYAAVLKAVADNRPLLLIIEDLHWVDAASGALLFHLCRELGDSQILLAGTYRPEEVTSDQSVSSEFGGHGFHPMVNIVSELKRRHGDIWIDLDNPIEEEGQSFVEAYLDAEPNHLDEGFRAALFQRTGGHALFTVELLQAMRDRGDLIQDQNGCWIKGKNIDWTTLPVRIKGVIERRLERLPEALRSILFTASIEGETFTAEVLARVNQMDDHILVKKLGRELDKHYHLVSAQSIDWLIPGQQRLSIYRFQHQLFQHYLYHQIDEVERAYLHESVGNVLEDLYQGRTRLVAGQLAHHFQAAGLLEKAIQYLTEAGDQAAGVHANIEAVVHYQRAAELAEKRHISTMELARLYVRLGGQLMVTKGDGSPEVGQAYGRALELYGSAGDSPERFAALRGLTLFYKLRGESSNAQHLSEEMLNLANSLQDPVLIVEACYAMGSHYFYLGDYLKALPYLERGIDYYEEEKHQSLIHLYGQDPGVANLCYACLTLWLLGYPDQALERSNQALELAQHLAHPYSLAMAYIWSAWLHYYLMDRQALLELLNEAISLSLRHKFTIFLGVGKLLKGWALIGQGDFEAGIAETQEGLTTANLAIGSDEVRSEWSVVLADSYSRAGQADRALNILSNALAGTEGSPNLQWGQPELFRLKGEILLKHGEDADFVEVETCYKKAIDSAIRQGAKATQLRAVMSMSRLWLTQQKSEKARNLLAAIYGWFTEGFGTSELREARHLLQELAGET